MPDAIAGSSMVTAGRRSCGGLALLCALVAIGGSSEALAQANITFRGGLCGMPMNGQMNWGTNLGMVAKFNATKLLRIRTQIDLDRAAMRDVTLGSYSGDQTATFTSIGFGAELEVGTKDYAFVAHMTPHMTIRSTLRILPEQAGTQDLWEITRFSLGATMGAGGEVFLSNTIGLELQAQYVIFNFDHENDDPRYRGLRLDAGIQFYLGQNFERPAEHDE